MRKLSLWIVLLLLLFPASAAAQGALFPALFDPVDQHMQQLAVMSQQDDIIGDLPYNQGTIRARGCAPLSIANPLIAAFGVTDRETAADLVYEIMAVLTPKRQYRRRPVAVERIARVLHQADRAESMEDFPQLAHYVGQYPGVIHVTDEDLTPENMRALLASSSASLLTGRVCVQEDWTQVVRAIYALHEMGHGDAFLYLGYAGAGTSSTGAPLRSGKSGHYLAAAIHVGTFVRNGALYILDSLPRALEGEPFGPEHTCHAAYPFIEDEADTRFPFAPTRISPTVIRLSPQEDMLRSMTVLQQKSFSSPQEKQDALLALHTGQLAALKLYGRCVMLVALPGA
ncbi:MAG: hypothetical protein IKK34_05100 [Clostridia bacterium]|nr:hypothetical protein [Clostridia bacterium]